MTPTEIFQALSILIALAALVVSAWFSWQRYQHDVASRNVSASVGLMKEWRAPEMREAEIFVLAELRQNYDSKLGFAKVASIDQRKALSISHLCDEIAMRVIFGEADPGVIFTSLGDQMVALWNVLAPFIQVERKVRSFPAYQQYFEAFANKVRATDIAKIREKKTNAFMRKSL